MKVNPLDWKFVPVDPEPGFSPEHNKMVVENSIKKYDKLRLKKAKEHQEGVEERSYALSRFLKDRLAGGRASTIEEYFGKKELARLRGQSILATLKHLKGTNAKA